MAGNNHDGFRFVNRQFKGEILAVCTESGESDDNFSRMATAAYHIYNKDNQ